MYRGNSAAVAAALGFLWADEAGAPEAHQEAVRAAGGK